MTPRHRAQPALLLGPSVVLLLVFFVGPLFAAAYTSTLRWDFLTPPTAVGAANYVALWEDGTLLRVLGITATLSVVVVAGSTALGLALALLTNRPGWLPSFVRSAIFSAYVLSWVSVALLWTWLLDRRGGAVNGALGALGVGPVDWLGDPDFAIVTLGLVTVWKIAGYAMVLFTAALQEVPRSLHEAAALDGAGPLSRFWAVTWPALRPTTEFVVTTGLILSFQVFDVVRVMTQGGPARGTTVFVYAIYEEVFMSFRVGRASALVVAFALVLLLLTALQLRMWARKGAPS